MGHSTNGTPAGIAFISRWDVWCAGIMYIMNVALIKVRHTK